MQSEFLFATFRSFLEDKESIFTWILFGATVLYFLRDCLELSEKVEKAEVKKGSAIRKITLDVILMVVGFGAALGSQWAAKTSDDKIQNLETNSVVTLNKLVIAERRLKEVEERPGKAKVSKVEAYLEFKAVGAIEEVKWKQFEYPQEDLIGVLMNLDLGRSSQIQTNIWMFRLVAEKFTKSQGPPYTTYWITFHMTPLVKLSNGGEMTLDQLGELDSIKIMMAHLPPNTEIMEGKATVTFNSSVIREFPIPAQKTEGPFVIFGSNMGSKLK